MKENEKLCIGVSLFLLIIAMGISNGLLIDLCVHSTKQVKEYNCSIFECDPFWFIYQLNVGEYWRRKMNHTSNVAICNQTMIPCYDYIDDTFLSHMTLDRNLIVYHGPPTPYVIVIIVLMNICLLSILPIFYFL